MGFDIKMIREWSKDGQDAKAVARISEGVQRILTVNEAIHFIAVQDKVLSLDVRPDAVVLTNRRFIVYRPKLLGGVTFIDHIWRDLFDVHLDESMMRATIRFRTAKGQVHEISALPKIQARAVYGFAQQKEHEALEDRRTREIEERRAASGGVVVHAPPSASAAHSNQQPVEDPVVGLQKIKQLLDASLISQAEFEFKKAEILKRL